MSRLRGTGVRLAVEAVLVLACYLEGFPNQTPGWNRPFVLSVLALVAVVGRRGSPLVAFLLGAPALGWAQSSLAPAVLAYTLASRERRGRVVLAALTVALAVDSYPLLDLRPGMWRADVSTLLELAALLGGAAALGAFRAARAEVGRRLDELLQARERETRLVDAVARTEERTRLAREMHDAVSHHVSLIALQAGALRVGAPSPQVRSAAEQIRVLAVRTTDELRQMLAALRAPGGQPLQAPGRLVDLPGLWAGSGLHGSLEFAPELADDLPDPLQRTLFSIAQEGLANAARHAPGARVHLRLERRRRRVSIRVENSAPTGAVTHGGGTGHGLLGVRERVAAARGTVRFGPTPDGGFYLVADLPAPVPADLTSDETPR
ncbi:sensor histidine kinase [Kineococcus rhizosphaerae]|uniref:histidine kinase n=1 Tax=Kineococcus rhizosphaerae TaxID=559628 RepID=A0A2T0QX59_9ACTN|nr:histidine kinase [Kineococcus rhizosphaerae]PRY10469.1 histidine kinase [Kineococcus rhizosphaerae]